MISRKVDNSEGIPSLLEWLVTNVTNGLKAGPVLVTLGREQRTGEQNSKFHPMIRDLMRHLKDHPIADILGRKDETPWRHYFVGMWEGQTMVPSLDGQQIIVVNKRATSKLSVSEGSSFIEFLYACGADVGVIWSDASTKAFEEYHGKNTQS